MVTASPLRRHARSGGFGCRARVQGALGHCAIALAGLGIGLAAVPAVAQQGFGLNCTIRPLRVVEVSSVTAGIIAEVMVEPGQPVEPGALLMRLDDRALRAELAVAEARATMTSGLLAAQTRRDGLQRRLDRLTRGLERRAVSAADHEAAALEFAMAEVDIQREQEALTLARVERDRVAAMLATTRIESPVAGIIGENLANPGEASLPDPVAQISVNQPLRVEAFVPVARVDGLLDQPTHRILVGDDPRPVPVTLDYVAPQADVASNTISVFFRLDGAPDVRPGSRCTMPGEMSW